MCSINNNSRKLPRWILIYIDLSFSSSVVQRLKWKIKCCISTSFCTLMPTDTQEQLILLKEFLHLQDSTMRSSIRNIWRESITSSAILNSNKQSCIQYNGPACFISCFNLLFELSDLFIFELYNAQHMDSVIHIGFGHSIYSASFVSSVFVTLLQLAHRWIFGQGNKCFTARGISQKWGERDKNVKIEKLCCAE